MKHLGVPSDEKRFLETGLAAGLGSFCFMLAAQLLLLPLVALFEFVGLNNPFIGTALLISLFFMSFLGAFGALVLLLKSARDQYLYATLAWFLACSVTVMPITFMLIRFNAHYLFSQLSYIALLAGAALLARGLVLRSRDSTRAQRQLLRD